MSQPLNKVGRELILDLINRTNQLPRPLTLDDVQFSPPLAIDVPEGQRNTQLVVYPAPNSNYIRSKVVTYWRLDFGILLEGELSNIGIADGETVANTDELIAILNTRYGLALLSEDVVYEDYNLQTFPSQVTLTAAPNSYAFIGAVTLTISHDLSQIITVNILDGLDYPTDALIENASPYHVTEDGFLLAGTGILGSYVIRGFNGEAEAFVGALRNGAGDTYVTPVNGVYNIPLVDTRLWNFVFGAGLIENNRVSTLFAGYDGTLDIVDQDGFSMRFIMGEGATGLEWTIEGAGPILQDSQPWETFLVSQSIQRIGLYGSSFPNATVNSAGAYLGTYTFTLTLTPKRAVYVKPIEVVVVANVTAA